MDKAFKRFVLLALAICLSVAIVNWAYITSKGIIYKKEDDSYFNKFINVPEQINICNFGSSHGFYGFNYKDCVEMSVFNFALQSQTLSYDARIMRQYEDRLESGGTVFLPVSYFSLYGSDETQEDDFQSKNDRYYYFLEPQYIKEFSATKYFIIKYVPVLNEDFLDWWWYIRDAVLKRDSSDTQKISRVLNKEEMEMNAAAAFERHNTENENGEWVINPEEMKALYDMIDLCHNHQVEPILVTTPYTKSYNDKFSDRFYEKFYSDIYEICNKTNCRYFDYSHDRRFVSNYEYFNDADHLSEKGAILFTDMIIKEAGITNAE